MRLRLYLIASLGLLLTTAASALADIPPTPEQKKKIEETPRISPKGSVTPLADRPFVRAAGGGKAKIVIPRAVFDELAAAVAEKSGGAAPSANKSSAAPPIALVISGLALSGAVLYVIAKAPRFRSVAAATAGGAIVGLYFLSTQFVEANQGPPPVSLKDKITIEVPDGGSEVLIFVRQEVLTPAGEEKSPASDAVRKAK